MPEQKNILLAVIISFLVLFGYQYFYEMPRLRALQAQQQAAALQVDGPQQPAPVAAPAPILSRETALGAAPRLPLGNPDVAGSLSLTGLRLDDLQLTHYRETVERDSPNIKLLSPSRTEIPYFVEWGWTAGQGVKVPDAQTVWQADQARLTPEQPVTLSWDNGAGLRFQVKLSLDAHYLLTLQQSVTNSTGQPVSLFPYALVSRLSDHVHHDRSLTGVVSSIDGKLTEYTFDKLAEEGTVEATAQGGFAGFGDKYWLVTVIPPQDATLKYRFREFQRDNKTIAQVDYLLGEQVVAPGATIHTETRLFAGAKEVEKLDAYARQLGLPLFDRTIDFGVLYFLTKPMFYALHYINLWVGNFGLAIIGLTILVRLVLAPVAHKSYKAMNRLKDLQPQMQELQARHKDDRMALSQAMMKLYQTEKVSPFSGCLPILIQIPVFLALYKVFLVSIEMRHAPFFGWIQDLSAPDPAYLVTAFGFLPWDPPAFLEIGIWPLLVGLTMWISQKLNPSPLDKAQQMVMNLLPVIFTFTTAHFAAGLAVYWTFNNLFSILQQKAIRWIADDKEKDKKAVVVGKV